MRSITPTLEQILANVTPLIIDGRVDERVADAAVADYDAGRRAMDEGDRARAADLFERSFAASPHAMALELRGICNLHLRRPGEAVADFAASTSLKRHVRPASLLAATLLALGEDGSAVDACVTALRLEPCNRLALEVWEELVRRMVSAGADTCER